MVGLPEPINTPNMFLNPKIENDIRNHAEGFPNEEVCGFVVFNGKNLEIIEGVNTSDNKAHTFSISPKSFVRASFSGEIVAYYHSHVSEIESFSELDKINAKSHKLTAILYHLPTDSFKEYSAESVIPSYTGREFQIGVADCVSLVRDYYKKELNVNLLDYFRDNNWAEATPNIFDEKYPENNLTLVKHENIKIEDCKLHDIVLFQFRDISAPSHAAIYLGNSFILHHPRNKYSVIERFSESFIRRAVRILRHKTQL